MENIEQDYERTFEDDITSLQKALAVSSVAGQDASALVPEDLEAESYNQLWSEDQFILLKKLPVAQATSDLHQLTQITDITDLDLSGFYPEGSLPNGSGFSSKRVVENIKAIGEEFAVTGIAGAVKSIQGLGANNLVDITERAKILAVQYKMTKEYYWSDTLGIANTTKFRGIKQIIEEDGLPEQVIDLRGNSLTDDSLNFGADVLAENWGFLSDIHLNSKALRNFTKTIEGFRQVQGMNEFYVDGIVGKKVDSFRHSHGVAKMDLDNFLQQKTSIYKNPPVYAVSTKPAPPNVAPTPLAGNIAYGTPGADPLSKFDATDDTDFGTYYYAVTADNTHSPTIEKGGESTALINTTGIVVGAGNSIAITITTLATDASYKIYRAIKASPTVTDFIFIGEIANTGATVVFTDRNDTISHVKDTAGNIEATTVAFGFSFKSNLTENMMRYDFERGDSMVRVQLLPIFKRPLPIVGDQSARALITSYTCMESPYPYRNILWKNAGIRNL